MHLMLKSTLLIFSVFLLNMCLFAQESVSEDREYLEELRKDQQEMRRELQEIKALLSKLAAQQLQPKPAPQQPPQLNITGVVFDIGDNHKAMMSKQESLKDLTSYANALGMNIGEFENCLNTGKYVDAVSGNMALAKQLGINGVPGFII